MTATDFDHEHDHDKESEQEITLPWELDRGSDGEYRCPVDGCEYEGDAAIGVPRHHYYVHDSSFAVDLFGEDRWVAYLKQEHVEKRRRPTAIARDFDSHIGPARVRDDLEEYDLYFDVATGNVPDATQILLRQDVRTIADAQREAARMRGEL